MQIARKVFSGSALWEMTVVCRIMCRKFVTHGFGGLLRCGWCCGREIAPSLTGIAPPLLTPSGSLPLSATGGAAVAHGGRRKAGVCKYKGTSRFGWSREKKSGKQIVVDQSCKAGRATEGPRDLCPGPRAWLSSLGSSHFEGLSLPHVFGVFLFHVSFCCT